MINRCRVKHHSVPFNICRGDRVKHHSVPFNICRGDSLETPPGAGMVSGFDAA